MEYARMLRKKDIAKKLGESLKEESKADKQLNDLALDTFNAKAIVKA